MSIWHEMRAHPDRIGYALALDVFFLLLYGFVTQPIRDRMFNGATLFLQSVSNQLQAAASTFSQPSIVDFFLADKATFFSVLCWMALLWLTAFILYATIEGTVWRLIQGQHKPWNVWDFGKAQLPWFVLGGALVVVNTVWALRGAAVEAMTKQTTSSIPEWIMLILLFVIVVFSCVTAAQRHPSARASLKLIRTKRVLIGVGIAALGILALDLLVRVIAMTQPFAGQLVGLVLVFPVLYAARLILIEACNVYQ